MIKPTLKEVARLANVSPSTASRALNGHPSVVEETRKRVVLAVEQLQYSPNILARNLRKRESQTIGFIVPDISNPFFSEVAKGIELEAHANNYRVILCHTGGDTELEASYARLLADQKVDGVLCITTIGSKYWEFDRLTAGGTPVVILDRFVEGFYHKLGSG